MKVGIYFLVIIGFEALCHWNSFRQSSCYPQIEFIRYGKISIDELQACSI